MKTTLQSAGSGTAGIAANLGRTMSSNPIPVLLTAIGPDLAGFLRSSSGNGKRRRELSDYDPGDLPRRVYTRKAMRFPAARIRAAVPATSMSMIPHCVSARHEVQPR